MSFGLVSIPMKSIKRMISNTVRHYRRFYSGFVCKSISVFFIRTFKTMEIIRFFFLFLSRDLIQQFVWALMRDIPSCDPKTYQSTLNVILWLIVAILKRNGIQMFAYWKKANMFILTQALEPKTWFAPCVAFSNCHFPSSTNQYD